MQIRNSESSYGLVAITLHWVVSATVIGLFALGFWMVDLDYYSAWYKQAPDIHRSVGILLFAGMVVRVVWRWISAKPVPLKTHKRFEVIAAQIAHVALYSLLFIAMVSGYLITTADGSSISVFGWFDVPSATGRIKGMEDVAGLIHYWATWAIVILASVHASAALKHHFSDKDDTLRRMLGIAKQK